MFVTFGILCFILIASALVLIFVENKVYLNCYYEKTTVNYQYIENNKLYWNVTKWNGCGHIPLDYTSRFVFDDENITVNSINNGETINIRWCEVKNNTYRIRGFEKFIS